MLREAGGIPSFGNDRNAQGNGERCYFETPDKISD